MFLFASSVWHRCIWLLASQRVWGAQMCRGCYCQSAIQAIFLWHQNEPGSAKSWSRRDQEGLTLSTCYGWSLDGLIQSRDCISKHLEAGSVPLWMTVRDVFFATTAQCFVFVTAADTLLEGRLRTRVLNPLLWLGKWRATGFNPSVARGRALCTPAVVLYNESSQM